MQFSYILFKAAYPLTLKNNLKNNFKNKTLKTTAIHRQIANGCSAEIGFLHIPKTGGSSVNAYGRALTSRDHQFPCTFSHGWRVAEIFDEFPKMELCFILRDPLSRLISGYNSRLRQGRPTYASIWSPAEAAAFAILPTVRHLLDAMLSDDDYLQSAIAYAQHQVRHLRWNYAFYFENSEFVRKHAGQFRLIGDISAFDDFLVRLTELAGAPRELAAALYNKIHEAGSRAEDALNGYSADEITRIKSYLGREYRLHSLLSDLAKQSCQQRGSAIHL